MFDVRKLVKSLSRKNSSNKMVVSEGAISNIMGGMENTAGVRLHSHRHKLKQRFDIIRKLGQGTYGKVQLAVNKETGQEVAIKTIKKAKIETEQDLVRIRREIQIMSSVQHPQIIHIFEVFENREKMVLVMEYAAGGELYDYLSERKVLSVEEARRVFRQVSSAVYYCHKHKICHRDLKLENILLDIEGNAKIADFGLSNVFDEKRRLDTFCGSPLYASPEIVKGVPYVGPEVDCWSLGVLLYTLVYGAMPFDGSNFKRLVKQITQGDFYEPPQPSTASPLVRSMLTVAAEKRANIADICSHWWVNDGEAKSCLDEAETLANQTPVRLDLLLSLAPKHISSEHMVIQPDDEDTSQRSDDGASAGPDLQLPPPPPVPPPPNGPQSRSLSMGALDSSSTPIDLVPTSGAVGKGAVRRRDEDKRRRETETPLETKKRKEAPESITPSSSGKPVEEEKKKIKKKSTAVKDEDKERKKSVKKKETSVEPVPMEVDQQIEKKKYVKKSVLTDKNEADVNEEKKKAVKKKDSSSSIKDSEKKRSVRKKESSADKSNVSSRETTPKAEIPVPDKNKEVHRQKSVSSNEVKASNVRSPSNKSVLSAISTDGTLKASDSSISTRHSVSPAKSVIEVDTSLPPSKAAVKPSPSVSESKPPAVKSTADSGKVTKIGSSARVSKNASAAKVSKNSSAQKIEKMDTSSTNGSRHDVSANAEDAVKDSSSINKDEPSIPPSESAESTVKEKLSSDNITANDSASSKDSSQHSSVVSTPARSRTGSESSTDAKAGSSRRGSKIFSKAALWDNMCQQQQSEKPPTSVDKGRKVPKPGGLNMTDLTKKFEEKPPSDRKKPIVGSVKISDVKKSFENNSSEKVSSIRRPSTDGSGDALPSKRGESTPVSPTRIGRKEDSLPPPGKSITKKTEPVKEKEPQIKKEPSPEKPKAKTPPKEKSPPKAVPSKPSPPKEVTKKENSPVKEVSKPVSRRDVTTPIRVSPTKEKPKPVTIPIKKVGSTNAKKESVTSASERPKVSDSKSKLVDNKKPAAEKFESSDSSDSESEAERLLRQLSERRERIEAAKQEKLRKVSQQQEQAKERIQRPCTKNNEKDEKSSLPPFETPSDTPDDMIPVKPAAIPKASMKDAEQPSSAKFASLPRGFKTQGIDKSKQSEYDNHRRKKSEVEIVLNNSTQSVPQKSGMSEANKRASFAEIQLASPQEYKTEVRHSIAPSSSRSHQPSIPAPGTTPPSDTSLQRAPRERIIPIMMEEDQDEEDDRSTASNYTDARTSSNTSLSRGMTQIPDSPFLHSPLFKGRSSMGGVFGSPSGGMSNLPSSRGSSVGSSSMASVRDQHRNINATASPEPIRKSRRERIIPISFEGDDTISPSSSSREPLSRSSQLHSSHGQGRKIAIERPESLSSNDDEEEEDEDDGFQILTAESLFSTLLNRVRNLTRKMNLDDNKTSRRMAPLHHQMLGGFSTSPFGSGGGLSTMGGLHQHTPLRTVSQDASSTGGGVDGGFWSSLYSSPREVSRQCSETSVDGRGDERGSSSTRGTTPSASGGEQGAAYNTLPRVRSIEIKTTTEDEEDSPEEGGHLNLPSYNNKGFVHQRPVMLHDKFFGGDM